MLEVVDFVPFKLPLFDEPIIPQAVTESSGYAHQHTRARSACISSFDAFAFVTPQYNWRIPAALKNALNFLFFEWKGKPAMVISYGGHGGGSAAETLRTACEGLRMRVVGDTVALVLPYKNFAGTCFEGRHLGLGLEESEVWLEGSEEVVALWEDMVDQLTVPA